MREKQKGLSVFLTIVLILVAAGAYYVYQQNVRGEAVAAALSKLREQAAAWDDADAIALSSSRIALPEQLSKLQSLRRSVNTLNVPVCLNEMQTQLAKAMDEKIKLYLMFLRNEKGYEEQAKLQVEAANAAFEKFKFTTGSKIEC